MEVEAFYHTALVSHSTKMILNFHLIYRVCMNIAWTKWEVELLQQMVLHP